MSFRLLVGRSGSGKTHQCLREIAAAASADPFGPPIIYLVPEQSSFQAEKELLQVGNRDGLTRGQVLSFARLNDYLEGGRPKGRPRLTDAHRRLLTALLVLRLREGGGARLAMLPGVEEALAEFIAESRQHLQSPDQLRAHARRLSENPDAGIAQPLSSKLLELSSILEGFSNIADAQFEDPAATTQRTLELISKTPRLQGAELYIDGFLDFTPVEESLLLGLVRRCANTTITCLADPDRTAWLTSGQPTGRDPIFASIEESVRHLMGKFAAAGMPAPKLVPCAMGSHPLRWKSEGLTLLEQRFQRTRKSIPAPDTSVRFVEAATLHQEARRAAEIAAEFLAQPGWNPGAVGIMVRDLETYRRPIEAALRLLKIPFFVDQSEPLRTHPIVNATAALGRVFLNQSHTESLLDLAKTGLGGVTRAEADFLQRHLLEYPRRYAEWWGEAAWPMPPPRSPDENAEAPRSLKKELMRAENARKGIIDFYRECSESIKPDAPPVEQLLGLMRGFLASLPPSSALEENAEIRELVEQAFVTVEDCSAGQALNQAQAVVLLQTALSDLKLPRIPPLIDQLFVGQLDRSRPPRLRAVILPGFAEGTFPKIGANRSFLNDGERDLLEEMGVELRRSSKRLFEREPLHAYRALTSAAEAVVVMRPLMTLEGEKLNESPFWRAARMAVGNPPVETVPLDRTLDRCWSQAELAAVAHREFLRSTNDRTTAAEETERAMSGDRAPARVLSYTRYTNSARLTPDLVAEFLSPTQFRTGASKLEAFGKCAFKHAASAFLKPRIVMKPEFEVRDAGNYLHAILKNITRLIRLDSLMDTNTNIAQQNLLYEKAAEEPRLRLRATGLLETGAGNFLLDRIDTALRPFVGWNLDYYKEWGAKTVLEEHSFSQEISGVELPGGRTLVLTGRVDRVDQLSNGFWLIFDYKSTKRSLNLGAVIAGEELQIPVYLLASKDPSKCAGGVYLSTLKNEWENGNPSIRAQGAVRESAYRDAFGDALAWAKVGFIEGASKDPKDGPLRGSALSESDFNLLLETSRETIAWHADAIISGNAQVQPVVRGQNSPCTYCDFRPLCGVDPTVNKKRQVENISRPLALEMLRG